ncbi:MAG: hypothetical protein IT158_27725 [Bryobacterales bacterium]|nr:hypothetical protein [Bryobacterales bacterium]
MRRRCGNPRCRCSRDQPHQAYVLTYKVHAKTKTVHVPKDLLMEVRRWVQEYRQVKKLIREISYQSLAILRHHVPASRAVARSRKLSRS